LNTYTKFSRITFLNVHMSKLELDAISGDPGETESAMQMGSMKRIKGLEFRAVAMLCQDESDPINRISVASLLERCERYVAATRAREYLLVTRNGESMGE